jgi:fructose transport system permease protein
VILTAGIDLSVGAIAVFSSVVMGQFTFRYGFRRPSPSSRLAWALGAAQRLAGRTHETAALHRDARHLADHAGLELHLFGQRDDPRQDIAAKAPLLQFWGTSLQPGGGAVLTLRRVPDGDRWC